ncbi:MAG: hypothetical protein C3F13_01595 [Anaerolineales bacterium]|nr:MAG: hypothetical protein C3F13_01595 [Anaerolineales bacterium]
MKKIMSMVAVIVLLSLLLSSCAQTATPVVTTAPEPTTAPAQPATGSIEGKKVCYLIPESGNAFLSGLTQGVKDKFAADGVEVQIFGAEGNATTQYNQIETCISQKVAGMIIMAALEPDAVAAAVEEAKAAGIKVMGVPVDKQGPYDAIMHTDQKEIGIKMATMACDWINTTYPDAADKSVEVAIISTKGTENLRLRTEGMETIDTACAKAKLVQFVDVPETTIAEAVTATENIFTANPNTKVILVAGDSGAQGAAQAIEAYAPNNLDQYAVYSGDVSPDTQEKLPTCEAGAYRGAVAIGGSLDDLISSTYSIMKGMISGTDYPKETLDPLTTFVCAPTAAAKPTAPEFIEIGASIPLTGKFGSLGSQVKVGYDYAIDAINANGGVYVEEYGVKIPLRLTAYDDESDPTKAVSNLEKVFSEQNVVAYLGGAASGMHAATTAIAEKNQVPYCGVSFAWWNIHQRGYKYLFSPFPKSPDQARDVYAALNQMIPADQRPTKVAIFQEKTDWGNELGGLFKADAKPAGYDVVYYAEYAPGTTDFSTMILDAQTAGAEILLGMPSTPDGIAIMKQLSELGWTPKFTMLVRAPDAATWGESLGTVGDYVTMFPGWHNAENFPGVAEINTRHQTDFGRPADVLVGPAYSCVQLFADAIERAGALDRDAIRNAMADSDMMTVIGPVTFNADGTGNVLNPMTQWLNGKMELVWTSDGQKSADFGFPAPEFDQR